MTVDHSQTYRKVTFRNIFHILRLKKILSTCDKLLKDKNIKVYADFGCSNGYITSIISNRYSMNRVYGYDHNEENLSQGKKLYPIINFASIDLNSGSHIEEKFEFITCFECLEHVGNINNALFSICDSITEDGIILITVPIEIGMIGIIKFLFKIIFLKYSLKELSGIKRNNYLMALLKNKRMSTFRKERNGLGTHFGFDYRDIDEFLKRAPCTYKTFNFLTSRFYIVYKRIK